MTDIEQKDLLKIGQLAKAAGVSISTIHYYVQQGLLTPPVKTSKNMAYYEPRCVDEIRFVQELQTRKYLPLSAIKLILNARREGQNIEHVHEMQSFIEEVFRPVEEGIEQRFYSLEEMISISGLSDSDLKKLETGGFITNRQNKPEPGYDDLDLSLARVFKKFLDFGFKLSDFAIYREFVNMARKEAQEIHESFHRLPDHEKVSLREILKTISDLKKCLELKAFRQEFQILKGPHFNKENPK